MISLLSTFSKNRVSHGSALLIQLKASNLRNMMFNRKQPSQTNFFSLCRAIFFSVVFLGLLAFTLWMRTELQLFVLE